MKRLVIFLIALTFIKCSDKIDSSSNEPRKCWCADTSMVDSSKPIPPFDRADKIISYHYNDSSTFGLRPEFPKTILHDHLNRKNIISEIDITSYKLELEKIFFNKIVKCAPSKSNLLQDSISGCIFFPHHCIVFYDKNDKPVDYFEICFMCDESHQSRDFGPLCGRTFCELKQLFKKAGHDSSTLYMDRCK